MVNWFKQQFGHHEQRQSDETGVAPEGKGRIEKRSGVPIAANHATYDALYHRVYQKMYGRLQPLYRAIQQITGYPQMS